MKFIVASAAAILAAGAAQAQTEIGVTMTAFDNPFLTVLLNGMRGEAERSEGVELIEEDAQLDVGRQLNQVQNFIASGVEAIIVNPVDGDSTVAITQMAEAAGIPLVYVNHPPVDVNELPENASFVGSNEIDSGTMQTEEVCKLMNGTGKAVVMMGPLENHSALVRTEDVHDVLARPECDGIEIVEEQTANWSRTEAQDLMRSWLTAGVEFDAVIANNDEMAIGAIQALKNAGVPMDDVVIAGIDATVDGLAAMEAGELDVTVFQNATKQGEVAVQSAVAMANGEPVERNIWIPFELVTPGNMTAYAN
jgi:ribose transport system substrate-binding protein